MNPLTAGDLGNYRRMRTRYLRYGRRAFRGRKWDEYIALQGRVQMALEGLDGLSQTVAEMYWHNALSCIAISMRIFYSERQVRRLRNKALSELLSL